MKKKAFIISPKGLSDAGGVERVMRYAAQALEGQGYRIIIVDRKKLQISIWGRVMSRLMGTPFGFFFESIGFSFLIRSRIQQGDIVIANGHSCAFYRVDLLFCHGSMRGFRFAVKGKRILYGPEELLEAIAGFMAKRVIAVSAMAGREWNLFYGVRKAKIAILRNCVDTDNFRPLAHDGCIPASPTEKLNILFIGRIGPPKGSERLMELVQTSEFERMSATLIIAAPSQEGTEWFSGKPGVRLCIGVPFADLPSLYRSCDVMYLPSRYEGFEMVTTEALACGIPVVGSNVGAIAELSRIGFPAVTVVDADQPRQALTALREAAAAWAPLEKKTYLAARTRKEFGLETWSKEFSNLVAEAADY